MKNTLIFLMGLSGVLANAIGAFGAHVLKHHMDDKMVRVFQTGVNYHFYHTIAIGLVLVTYMVKPNKLLIFSGYGFFMGICLFSGSLYLLTTMHYKWVGPLTPLGGLCFITSWILFAYSMLDH